MIRGKGECVSAGFCHWGDSVKETVQQLCNRLRASYVAGDAGRGCRPGGEVAKLAALSGNCCLIGHGQTSLGSQAMCIDPLRSVYFGRHSC